MLAAKVGSPRHAAADVVVGKGQDATVEVKLAYGKASKDLEDEDATLWLWSGKRWRQGATARTDDDGRARFRVAGAWLARPGAHPFAVVVHGDGSRARGTLWVTTPKTKAVVFDIDGTLTTGDREIVEYALTGRAIDMRPDANALVRHWAQRGVLPVYLTGRPYLFNASTRRWLKQKGFPSGPVITVESLRHALPTQGGVGAFKEEWLVRAMHRAGLEVIAAYGNASTDICAFARAGIAPSATFIIGKNGGRHCEGFQRAQGVSDWGSHLRQLSAPQR